MTDEVVATLEEMTDDELAAWLPGAIDRFVAERVAAGESAERATSMAAMQREMSFPGGTRAAGHHAMHVVVGDQRVGAVWISSGPATDSTERYVAIVELDEASRTSEFMAAAIKGAEQWAVTDGATRLALNVFGENSVVLGSYERLGYVVAATSMFKPLA